jgi:hypothetical protein
MEEKANRSIGEFFADHRWQEHQVIIVDPNWGTREYDNGKGSYVRTNISFAVVRDDDICESLIHRLVLGPRCGLVEGFCLWSIGYSIVESGPQNLESTISLQGVDDVICRA